MGNRARELLDQGKTVLFAFEEAIGKVTSTLQDAKHLCGFVCNSGGNTRFWIGHPLILGLNHIP